MIVKCIALFLLRSLGQRKKKHHESQLTIFCKEPCLTALLILSYTIEDLIQYSLGSTLTKCSKTYTRIFMGHVFIKNAERNEKLCLYALLISLVVLKTRFLYLMRAHDKPRRTASSQTQVEGDIC